MLSKLYYTFMGKGQIKKYLYLFIGCISLGMGLLGLFLPVLPTTPFLLLTAYLFYNSDKVWHDRLMNHPVTGPIIKDYTIHKSITFKKKVIILSTLWITMTINMVWIISNIWIQLLLLLISIGVTIHILRIKTRRV